MIDWLINLLSTQFTQHGYLIIFVGMLLENASGIGSLLPGDTLLILAGFFSKGTSVSLPLLFGLGLTGAVIGDNLSYWVGRRGGHGNGRVQGNMHLKAPDATPMANVMLGLLHQFGCNDVKSFGDSTDEFSLSV